MILNDTAKGDENNAVNNSITSLPVLDKVKSEAEGFGLVYERYAFGKLLHQFVEDHDIQSVLELPGGGVKAMPSIYSLCMGLAGSRVTIVNGERSSLKVWKQLGIEDRVSFIDCDDLTDTGIADNSYDFVWNFVVMGTFSKPDDVLKEMTRVSRRYVCLFLSNKRNIGYALHRFAHWQTKIPWTHGDVSLRKMTRIKRMMRDQGMVTEKAGFVDSPPWPDSVGFRDIRLHRLQMENNIDLAKVNWRSDYIDFLQTQKFPFWIKLVYFFESIPMPPLVKQFYSHLFYVLGRKS